MKRRHTLLLALGALVCAAVLVTLFASTGARAPSGVPAGPSVGSRVPVEAQPARSAPAEGPSAPDASVASVESPSSLDSKDLPEPLADPLDLPLEVYGHVLDLHGQRRAGLDVALFTLSTVDWPPAATPRLASATGRSMEWLGRRALGDRASVLLLGWTQTTAGGRFRFVVPGGLDEALAEAGASPVVVVGDPSDPSSLACDKERDEFLDDDEGMRLQLSKVSLFRLTVRGAGGGMAGARVWVAGEEPGVWGLQFQGETDAEGTLVVRHRGLEEVELTVHAPGYATLHENYAELPVELAVELQPGFEISGVVTTSHGDALSGVTVVADPDEAGRAAGQSRRAGKTDERGAFVLDGLAAGVNYTLAAVDPGGRYLVLERALVPPLSDMHLVLELASRLELTLQAKHATYAFRLLDFLVERQEPGGGWTVVDSNARRRGFVQARRELPAWVSPTTQRVEFRRLPPGNYRVRGVGGMLASDLLFTLRPGEVTKGTLRPVEMRRASLKLTGSPPDLWVSVNYPVSPRPLKTSLLAKQGVLELALPPAARACVIEASGFEPLRVELPVGVTDLGTLELEPKESEEQGDRRR